MSRNRRRRPRAAHRLAAAILHSLAPANCLHCGARLPLRLPDLHLCPKCSAKAKAPDPERCLLCSAFLARSPLSAVCLTCRPRLQPVQDVAAAWRYEAPMHDVLRAFKFGGLGFLAEDLAQGLSERLVRWDDLLGTSALVVPVPLHWRRRWRRGYDQVDLLASSLAKTSTSRRLARVLRRRRATRAQSALDRAARRANVAGAFALRRGGRDQVAGRDVVLLDDVLTTGATLCAAGYVLKASGATSIRALVVASRP